MERLTYCGAMLWEAVVVSGVTARRSARESVEECEGLGREKYEGKGRQARRNGGKGVSSHAQLVRGRKVLSSGYMKEDKRTPPRDDNLISLHDKPS
ncbi:hypothetical protein E2C01_037414 [Portunus trituberculatus]|uniref:Uncharacterized protein n=1 Tax=Portunus trituberculatus TaxID=210409 RepID=A0A5B7FBC7_PORTR|nr:hypothetical protein [Portunus trituberculatus]